MIDISCLVITYFTYYCQNQHPWRTDGQSCLQNFEQPRFYEVCSRETEVRTCPHVILFLLFSVRGAPGAEDQVMQKVPLQLIFGEVGQRERTKRRPTKNLILNKTN